VQTIETKAENKFLRTVTGTWQAFGLPQEGMKTSASEHTIERPRAEKAGTGLVQLRPFVNVVEDAFLGIEE